MVSEEETEKGPEKIVEERTVDNFLNLEKLKSAKYRKFRVPPRMNPKENTPRHIVIKITKIKGKEKTLEAAREKQQITCKGIPITLPAAFSAETADQSDFSSSFSSNNGFSSSHVQM